MSSNLTTGHQEMLHGLPRNVPPTFRPHWTPNFAGNDTSRKVSFYPLLLVRCSAFQHLSSLHFGAFNPPITLRRVEDVRGDIQTHTQPFTQTAANPVRERPLANC
ncbi:hypothetical protein TNIN_124201 [Trichonephila inaurata madagascariensis]|uniref:Uncharacterized protein n=1 Tax=Trichonephila inaurata madagascariensis TaxID=2747483 RepID=A0A8X7CBJ6_9ARAC|nr:hypothetical protein TNIN_124201 [Trichonephila inaurata madagascariensis]